MKIAIFASIWAQNLWDELILKNEIKLLEKEYWKNTQFFVFSYDYKNPFLKQKNIKYIEYFPIWIKKIKNLPKNIFNFFNFLRIIIKSDIIVIWWWWIIYDREKQTTKNPLNSWVFRKIFFRFFCKKVYFYAVWINIKKEKNLNKVKKIFKNSFKVKVRDSYSFNLLKKLWIESEIIKDPVFYDNEKNENIWESYLIKNFKSNEFSFKNLENLNLNLNWKKVGLALRRWYLHNNWTKLDLRFEEWKVNELINYILKSWGEIILLPHSFHKTDLIANDYEFLKTFLRENWKIKICHSMKEVYEVYLNDEIDLNIAMRLHSIILSQVYEIPFIWVSYSTKTDEILNSL